MSKNRIYKSEQAVKDAVRKMRAEALFGLHQEGYNQEKADAISRNLERLERFLLAELKAVTAEDATPRDGAFTEEEKAWFGEDNLPKKPVGGWSW